MARRKKRRGRSARNARKGQTIEAQEEEYKKYPHSFVFQRGEVGRNVRRLVMDVRQMMEPYTARNLKVSKKNVMKDFISIAGPLNVTHLVTFSKSEISTYMRLIRLPRGPTMTFKVHSYCLSRDVVSSLKRNQTTPSQFLSHPLLIMNHLSGNGMHLKLMATMFQNMFPSINVNSLKLNDVKRCVLLNYCPETKTLDLRHYNIRVVPVGMSRAVKKLIRGHVPNLSGYNDISDFVLGDGNLSESEVELDGDHNEVTLPQDMPGRGNTKSAKSAIRLTEIGPRMTLQLIKIEEGVCSGDVMYHEYVEKTPEETAAWKQRQLEKKKLKEQRRRQQELNVKRKKTEMERQKQQSLAGMKKSVTSSTTPDAPKNNSSDEQSGTEEQDDDDEDDDVEYFRQEVGQDPDPDLFQRSKSTSHRADKRQVAKPKQRRKGTDSDSRKVFSKVAPRKQLKFVSTAKDLPSNLAGKKRTFPFKRTGKVGKRPRKL